jgi:hypothetical protein
MEGNMIKNIIYFACLTLLILPARTQVTEKIQEMHNECRLVRGHAYMIQQMIDENNYNESVARAHFSIIDTNLKALIFTLREVETILTNQQKMRVGSEMERLFEICNDSKPIIDSMREHLNEDNPNLGRIRVLAIRINRNLRDAMSAQDTLLKKL